MANSPTYRDRNRRHNDAPDTPEEKAQKRAAWFALPRKTRPEKPKAEKPNTERVKFKRASAPRAKSPDDVAKLSLDGAACASNRHRNRRVCANCHGLISKCASLVIEPGSLTCAKYSKTLAWCDIYPAGIRRCKECKLEGVW